MRKRKINTAAALVLFFVAASAVPRGLSASGNTGNYFPLHIGNTWYYKAYKRGEDEVYKSITRVTEKEKIDGMEYFYFKVPYFDVGYMMRKTAGGVYARIIRFPFLAFSITVDIIPEMKTLSLPLKKGKKWSYEGKGKTKIFGFIEITRDIYAEFEVDKKGTIKTAAGELEAYHIRALIDQGDGKLKLKKYWYAAGVGFASSDNDDNVLEVTGYRLYSGKKQGFVESLPPDVEKYE